MKQYHLVVLEGTKKFLRTIDIQDRGKIYKQIELMETGNFSGLFIKTINSPLKELKMGKYRILFFIHRDTILITSAFIKKSQKTPRKEILKAQKIISLFLQKS
jgi:phage-related protein